MVNKKRKIEDSISKLKRVISDVYIGTYTDINMYDSKPIHKDLLCQALGLDFPVVLYSYKELTIYWPRTDLYLQNDTLFRWEPQWITVKLGTYSDVFNIFWNNCYTEKRLSDFLGYSECDIFDRNIDILVSHLKSRSEKIKNLLLYEAI